ncbi:MAG: pilus assembly protein CpaE [Alphaproteobacteria bacterium]|nr:MAG: pilus assembly protein CpaE [Alphaproteobacteria bacterium]
MNTASDMINKDKSNEFAAFVCDSATTEVLVPILSEREWPLDSVATGGVENAIRTLGASPSPRFLLVDLSDSTDPRADLGALAEVCEPGTAVIALGTLNDVALYRDLIDAGIIEYFVKPVTTDEIRMALLNAEQALRLAAEGHQHAPEEEVKKVISVIGVRGGTGASLLASSTAWLMANELGRKVALLDLDIHFGTDALVFDLEPGRGLVDALDNPSRVDGLFIERAVIKESDNLAVLSAEASLTETAIPDPSALGHLIEELRNGYEVVVVDAPRHLIAQHPPILTEATDIMVVTDLSLAGTRDTIRILNYIKDVAPSAAVRLVANRLGSGGPVEVEQKDFETSVERKLDWVLPFDPRTVVTAAKRGKPLPQAAANSKLVALMKSISEELVGNKVEDAKPSVWKSLLAIGKK